LGRWKNKPEKLYQDKKAVIPGRVMNIRSFFFSLLCLTTSFSAWACPKQDCIRIGSWNIAWLGSDKRQQSSDPATIQAMANLIADEWSIDLISLQEINTALDGNHRGEHYSTKQWQQLKKSLEAKGYKTQSGDSGNAQRVVLAWRKPVVAQQLVRDMAIPESYFIDDFCRSSNLRKPLAGLFQAEKFDFWVIGLHLKSGYGGNAACANAVRENQVYYIAKQISNLKKSDKDIIIMGDFNASSTHSSLQNFSEYGLSAITDKSSRSESSGTRTQGAGKRGAVIDLIMLDLRNTSEWTPRSTVLFKPDNFPVFVSKYSDHMPIWADFVISKDDD